MILGALRIRSFRFQFASDLVTSWAFEMETVILGWYVMVNTGSVLWLTGFRSLQFLGTLAAPVYGVLGDRLGARSVLCAMRTVYSVLAAALRLVDVSGTTIERGTLLCQLGEVLDAAGRLNAALDLHRRAVELLDAEPKADEIVLAHAYNRLGHVLNCADDTAGAIAAHERSLKTLRAVHRDDLGAPVLVDLGYTLWADGSPLEPTPSSLYFATKDGKVYRLPQHMTGATAKPELVP